MGTLALEHAATIVSMDLGRNGGHMLAELADSGRPSIAATTGFATDVPVVDPRTAVGGLRAAPDGPLAITRSAAPLREPAVARHPLSQCEDDRVTGTVRAVFTKCMDGHWFTGPVCPVDGWSGELAQAVARLTAAQDATFEVLQREMPSTPLGAFLIVESCRPSLRDLVIYEGG